MLVLWPQLRKALEQRFGKPRAGHQLILQMMKLQQKTSESVEAYTVRFDSLHMEQPPEPCVTGPYGGALYGRSVTASEGEG